MKQLKWIFLFGLLCLTFCAQAAVTPVGYYQTIDDETGKPKAIVQIGLTGNSTLYGRIVKLYPREGLAPNPLCIACKGSLHNQPIIGMVILQGLKQNKSNPLQWEGGRIIDPKTGKQYNCYLEIQDNGRKLKLRGYIGFSIIGRTQMWLRVK